MMHLIARSTRLVGVGAVAALVAPALFTGPAVAHPSAARPAAKHAEPLTCATAVPFHRGNFSYPTTLDNRFLPLVPGTKYVLEGRANRGGGATPPKVGVIVSGPAQ